MRATLAFNGLSRLKRTIGQRSDVGSFGFQAFCSALKIPYVISLGYVPLTAVLLHISATSGKYFISVTLIWSIPGLLLFFRVHIAFLFSDEVNCVNPLLLNVPF